MPQQPGFKPPPIGSYRTRIHLQSRATEQDGFGNSEGQWTYQFSLPARIAPLRGSEAVIAQRLAGIQPVIITMRFCGFSASITPEWRAIEERSGTVYNIRSATPDERRRVVEMLCEAGRAT